jgi:predicted esterase
VTTPKLRVLFVHGLASSPQGRKARYLAERFDALTPAMETGDFLGCLETQRQAIAAHQPEVVIGSSFGGAVVVELMRRGEWQGPTLLLAQAALRVNQDASLPAAAPVLLVHGRRDEVVPVAQSRTLAATSEAARLIETDDEHRLVELTRSERLAELVHEAAALYAAGGCP